MEKKKKILLLCIIIIVIVIIILAVLLRMLSNSNNVDEKQNNEVIIQEDLNKNEEFIGSYNENEYNDNIIKNKTLNYVETEEEYYIIKKIYTKYLTLIADNDTNMLIEMFSKDYCNKYNINENNIMKFTGISKIDNVSRDGTYTSIISDMFCIDVSEDMKAYLVYGKYLLKSTGKIGNLNLMIIINNSELVYDVYPYSFMQDNNYTNLKVGATINISKYKIENRKTNIFSYNSVSDQDMAKNYFDDWCNNYLYDTKNAYNKLNTKYKNIKFNSYDKFNNYVSKLGYIPKINEYRRYSTKDYTDYICTDQYNNYYIFRQQGGIMRYTVFLDSYTVELDTFKENYEKAEDNTKIAIQIGKFKQMLNSKDYNAIYEKLNSTFKKNNYSTVAKLESYLSKNIYDINTIIIEDYSKNEDYYVCKCILQNQKNTNEQKNMTIIIKLIDSNNFEMSFSFNE